MHEIPEQNETLALRNKAFELLRQAREQGTLASEARGALTEWMEAAERNVMASGGLDKEADAESQIQLIFEEATLLREAGFYKEAFDVLNDAQTQARQQGRRDLFDKAGDMMDELNTME